MDPEILKKLNEQENKLQMIYVSVEKTRKYFLWTLITTLIMFFLPLLGLAVAIPWLLSSLGNAYGLQ